MCQRDFTEKSNLNRHVKVQHANLWTCQNCSTTFNRYDNFCYHSNTCNFKKTGKRLQHDQQGGGKKQKVQDVEKDDSALQNAVEKYSLDLSEKKQGGDDIFEVLSNGIYYFKDTILNQQRTKNAIKFYVSLHINFHLSIDHTFITDPPIVLNTMVFEVLDSTNLNETLDNVYDVLVNKMDSFCKKGSGWTLHQLLKLEVHILEYQPLTASTYFKIPKEIEDKKAVINVQNDDNRCFFYALAAAIYSDKLPINPSTNQPNVPHRSKQYEQYYHNFNWEGISFPVMLKDIPKFERRNNIAISVYGWNDSTDEEKGYLYPLKVSKEPGKIHVQFLLIENEQTQHYCWIKNFSRINGDLTSEKKVFCRYCLHGFNIDTHKDGKHVHLTDQEMEQKLQEHESNCFVHGGQRIQFPKYETVQFENIKHQVRAPYVVYADLEAILDKLTVDKNTKTQKYQHHIACSYSYKIVSNVCENKFELRSYFGEDALDHFLSSLEHDLQTIIMPKIENDVAMIWNNEAQEKFDEATCCHICGNGFDDPKDKVRDHSHFDGSFRGAAHSSCNLNYKIDKKRYCLPIFLHNSRHYDTHLIVQAIKKSHGKVRLIPNNMEKYVSFSLGRLRFCDSFQFLTFSLEKLAKTVKHFKYLKEEYSDETQRCLLTKKGVYPYDYMDCMERFSERELPSRDKFFNTLNQEEITEEKYCHAQRVWDAFNCKTLLDYHDIYLKSDVLLLSDVFEEFRDECLSTYQLDPAHYFSLPGFSWDAALKYSKVKLQLIKDIDMYEMVESGIRGGVSMISHRYAEAKNPHMKSYNADQNDETLLYIDANSLYAHAMTMPLPVSEFTWLNEDEIDDLDLSSRKDNDDYGYIFDVDLHYPAHLHHLHNCYPLAPEHLQITREMLSPYQQEHFQSKTSTIKKLVPNLQDKSHYICHYRNLQLYVDLGLEVKKIHRVIKFKQSAWLAEYINFNIAKREKATLQDDEAGRSLYKLLNNAVSCFKILLFLLLSNTHTHIHTHAHAHAYAYAHAHAHAHIHTHIEPYIIKCIYFSGIHMHMHMHMHMHILIEPYIIKCISFSGVRKDHGKPPKPRQH